MITYKSTFLSHRLVWPRQEDRPREDNRTHAAADNRDCDCQHNEREAFART